MLDDEYQIPDIENINMEPAPEYQVHFDEPEINMEPAERMEPIEEFNMEPAPEYQIHDENRIFCPRY